MVPADVCPVLLRHCPTDRRSAWGELGRLAEANLRELVWPGGIRGRGASHGFSSPRDHTPRRAFRYGRNHRFTPVPRTQRGPARSHVWTVARAALTPAWLAETHAPNHPG